MLSYAVELHEMFLLITYHTDESIHCSSVSDWLVILWFHVMQCQFYALVVRTVKLRYMLCGISRASIAQQSTWL